MHLKFRNVNDAFRLLVQGIHTGTFPTRRTSSRFGDVIQVDEPVLVTYSQPRERVLFNQARDHNPFLAVYETLWMMAGRNDVAPVTYYSSKYGSIVSDDGVTQNGAYGYRWRHAKYPQIDAYAEVDQLNLLVAHLKADPNSRRAVLQMWNVEDDLLKVGETKDVVCNTAVYFSLRDGNLDMTVTNRSNDLVWGLCGTNYVHFSLLQEYLATRLGAEVGLYHHFTNNLHAYTATWKPEEWLAWGRDVEGSAVGGPHYLPAKNGEGPAHFPFVRDPEVFDSEVKEFVRLHANHNYQSVCWFRDPDQWTEPFLQEVAKPMCQAFHLYKTGCETGRSREACLDGAMKICERIAADDWRIAATNWIEKRRNRHVGQ